MKLGLVTYNAAREWDLPTLLDLLTRAGWDGVELRTQHAHGVELALGAAERAAVRRRFSEAGVALWALGTTCEYHAADPAAVRANIEETKRWCALAEEIGARGVKVRPNGITAELGRERTLEQIGAALRECGEAAAAHGVEIFLEVHGRETQEPRNIRAILDHCGHESVGACWNSNATDVVDGSVERSFDLLAPDIKSCHITELWNEAYPYRELFGILAGSEYDGFTLCELGTPIAAESALPFLKCYRRL
ncbi:MAG TPA: TIM barrel protein, partial [Chthonomonadaceae bacterium]|nr:TIM barrel protein [Chthonomonadaceae bacterium]